LVTRLGDKVISDIFTSARLRITLLYFLVGALILGIAGTLTYNHTIDILNLYTERLSSVITDSLSKNSESVEPQNISQIVEGALEQRQQNSEDISATLKDEIRRMIYSTSLWMILAILISAYVLAGITLKPIERALENKKRFIANASHELRTPLSIMKTSSESTLLDEKNVDREELISTLKSNIEEVNRMSNILQFLFAFSSFEHRTKVLAMSPIDISEITQKCIQTLQTAIQKKKINIEVWNDQGALVRGNAIALEEVLLNLLKNAIRYTPEQGHIRIVLEKKLYGIVTIVVRDSGIGIPPEEIRHVFEPFYKGNNAGDSSKKNSKSHAGLGLAIVKEIITTHRGTISIQSKLGEGTSVEIRLPSASGSRNS
jgi:signal transduction histidine kinase